MHSAHLHCVPGRTSTQHPVPHKPPPHPPPTGFHSLLPFCPRLRTRHWCSAMCRLSTRFPQQLQLKTVAACGGADAGLSTKECTWNCICSCRHSCAVLYVHLASLLAYLFSQRTPSRCLSHLGLGDPQLKAAEMQSHEGVRNCLVEREKQGPGECPESFGICMMLRQAAQLLQLGANQLPAPACRAVEKGVSDSSVCTWPAQHVRSSVHPHGLPTLGAARHTLRASGPGAEAAQGRCSCRPPPPTPQSWADCGEASAGGQSHTCRCLISPTWTLWPPRRPT